MFMLALQGWCPWCEGHMGWGGGWMMWAWLVVLLAVLWGAWTMLRRGSGTGRAGDGAEALLRERYARGEIDEATYRRMLDELRRPRPPG